MLRHTLFCSCSNMFDVEKAWCDRSFCEWTCMSWPAVYLSAWESVLCVRVCVCHLISSFNTVDVFHHTSYMCACACACAVHMRPYRSIDRTSRLMQAGEQATDQSIMIYIIHLVLCVQTASNMRIETEKEKAATWKLNVENASSIFKFSCAVRRWAHEWNACVRTWEHSRLWRIWQRYSNTYTSLIHLL